VLSNTAHTLCALKRVLKSDVGNFEKELTYRAGVEMFHCYTHREFGTGEQMAPKAFLDHLIDLFAGDGVGTFDVTAFDHSEMFMELTCPDSIETVGYLSHGEIQTVPSCSFVCGLLAGMGKHLFANTACEGPEEIVAAETTCASTGEKECHFMVGKRARLEKIGLTVDHVRESISEHALRLNEEILLKNLELQNLNLDLERQVRKRTEDLKRSEEDYRSLVNLSPDAVIICFIDGTVKSLNEAALSMLGFEPGNHLESKNISSLLLDGSNAWERCVWLVNKEGVLRNQEFDFAKKSGKIVGEVSARIVDLHPERCIQMVIRDVTERNLLRTAMEEAKGESEFFNDLLSHDIVNYMSAAMHFLDKLPSSRNMSPEDLKALSIVSKDVKGAYELAAVVRDLSRAEALGESECREATDVCGVVAEAVEDAKRMYSERRVTVNVDRPATTCYVEGSTLLTRLFVNLLTNAIKFDPSGEARIDLKIESATHKGADYWSISISDHGKGIPDHEKEKVFERYFRGDSGVTGTGLGLHVVRKIARACGGLVWAENLVQGDYTKGTVMVTLLRKAANGQNNHKH
jgi:PAS domain S-box-containing protein